MREEFSDGQGFRVGVPLREIQKRHTYYSESEMKSDTCRQKVLVIQRRMTHYRLPFFEALRRILDFQQIDLIVAYGEGHVSESSKSDSGDLDWGIRLPTTYFLGGKVCWQPFGKLAGQASLIIFTHENKLIYNLWQQFFNKGAKVALWGHGANLQGRADSLKERFKRKVAKRADWWFGYTEMSRPIIDRSGFPRERVSILNNSVDTKELKNTYLSVSDEDICAFRRSIGLAGANVCAYVGSFYDEKRVDFLLEAGDFLKKKIPDFELILMGGGEQESLVVDFCRERSWAYYLGVRKGRDKVIALSGSKLLLNPGLVGLGILDSFVCRVPIVTTDCGLHSPEISYLENGINGVMTENTIEDYVDSVFRILNDQVALESLKLGCAESGDKYTVENMARNFADGVVKCLKAEPSRGSL